MSTNLGSFASAEQMAITHANTARLLNKLRRGQENCNWTMIGDSTGNGQDEHFYFEAQYLAAQFPAFTVIYHLLDPDSGAAYDTGTHTGTPITIQTGTGTANAGGPFTLNIWNCSVSGTSLDYAGGGRYTAAVKATTPDLVSISHGHNTGSAAANDQSRAAFAGILLALTERITHDFPMCGVVIHLQNPETGNVYQQLRAAAFESVAAARGYGIINAQQAFLDLGANLSAYIKSDGVHPTNSGDAPGPDGRTGSQVWADVATKAMFAKASVPAPRAQTPSFFEQVMPQECANGDFSDWTGTNPTGWNLTGATLVKDTRTGYGLEEPLGYAARIQATGAAASSIYQDIPVPASFAGRWVCLAVLMRVDSTQSATAGRISVQDSTTAYTQASEQNSRDGFQWKIVPYFVNAGTTLLRVRIYADSGANAGADISVARVWLTRGFWPNRGAVGAKGPAGPAGTIINDMDHLSTVGTNPAATGQMYSAGSQALTANRAVLTKIIPQRNCSIAKLIWGVGTTGGNYDIGIYNAAGTLLWSKGSTTVPASGAVTETPTPVTLVAGSVYYVAFVFDNASATIRAFTLATTEVAKSMTGVLLATAVTAAFPLPSTITVGATGSSQIPVIALRES